MVLIDSPIDLMATASRDQPVQAGVRPTILDTTGYDPWRDIYLQGVYEKRVQQLEQFAKEKSFDYEVADPSIYQGNRLSKRRQMIQNRRKNQNNRRIAQESEHESEGIYDYFDPSSYSGDFYGAESSLAEDKFQLIQQQQPVSITQRVANAIFNPVTSGIFAIISIPMILAGLYWLFVVNGPTPVVKARIEEMASIGASIADGNDLKSLVVALTKAIVQDVDEFVVGNSS